MIRMFRSEWTKIQRFVFWLLVFFCPLIIAVFALLTTHKGGSFNWLEALLLISALHAMLLLPLLTGVYSALMCRYEHMSGGWKMMLASPVSRTQVYIVKFIIIMLLLAATQLLIWSFLLLIGCVYGFSAPIPWHEMTISFVGGWVACLPLAALQLFVSVAFQSFAAPLAVNAILTLPNILVVNSMEYGPYYPWVQPMLAMLPRGYFDNGAFNFSQETLLYVVLGSFCLFFIAGWTYFMKKAV